ncbi:phosphonate C-P lyase system protein PhnG [Rhizobium sp. ARZ01]|uniref:phosphonate C-P lyase system protein PhnG n=1 Tax=Rhizobium sp. ARZ01 TaxID=2769313 RepID=UPI001785257A|nr:phosphonate C-P lyase system protein PhnG [Rhizobium sp. ARZ01]MBD9373775.1 phosphonate C-P lyase system protein PhnG [Rhizobium sp. ARZ01]
MAPLRKQPAPGPEPVARKRAMDILAKATRVELESAWAALATKPVATPVRGPETGLVMVRGRIGGGGAPFNLGEVTATRASVRLDGGVVGHGQTLGTDGEKARLAAVFDALLQVPEYAPVVERLLSAVSARIEVDDARKARETAATRVDFFTLVRGDD